MRLRVLSAATMLGAFAVTASESLSADAAGAEDTALDIRLHGLPPQRGDFQPMLRKQWPQAESLSTLDGTWTPSTAMQVE